MSNQNDFVIENGVLKKYKGKDTVVVVPDGVTSIGNRAFYERKSLTGVTLPEGMTSIGNEAFRGCESLTSVTLPEGLTSIGNGAFRGCKKLADKNGFVFFKGILFDYYGEGGHVTLPEGLSSIGDSAFSGCESLTSVTLPEGLTSIGNRAFNRCKSLTSVTLLEGLTSIGNEAFEDCESLTSITLPKGLTSIGDWAFSGCSSLTSVTLPEGLTSIGRSAFMYCKSLTDITLPEGLTSIGNMVFYSCESLTSVTLPEGLTSIGYEAFDGCESLTSVTLPEGLTSIGDRAFAYCGSLTGVTLPEELTNLGDGAFAYCRSLTGVTLPEGLTSIGDKAFFGCKSLTDIMIPKSVQHLGDCLFDGCSAQLLVRLTEQTLIGRQGQLAEGGSFMLQIRKENESFPLAYGSKTTSDILAAYGTPDFWKKYDMAFANEDYKCSAPVKLLGAAGRLLSPEVPDEQKRDGYRKRLRENAAKTVAAAEKYGLPEVVRMLFSEGIVNEENEQKVRKQLKKSKDPAFAALAQLPLAAKEEVQKEALPAEGVLEELLKEENLAEAQLEKQMKDTFGIVLPALPSMNDVGGNQLKPTVLAFLLLLYADKHMDQSELARADGRAERLLPLVDCASFQSALCALSDEYFIQYQNGKKLGLTRLVCRYADEDLMRELCARAPKWATSVSGNDAPMLLEFRNAVRYSDTRSAMLFADRYHELEAYAALRGTDADTLRDAYLSDVGLDETRGKAYDLGNQVVTARLQKDLSFLFELPNGKTAKSLPKKGADEEKYAAAKADFDAMRKSVKKILKNRADRLFEDFLSGRARDAAGWQAAYLRNPLLREAAGKLVWAQEKACFTLTDSGAVNSAGDPYTITEKPIRVAHPMEMAAAEAEAWQRYFSAHGIRQPFEQVWEPVIDPADIREDRYEGVEMWFRIPSGKQKHGVDVYGFHAYSEVFGIELKDCDLEYEASTWRYDPYVDDDVIFTLGKFTFPVYNRQVNHIVSLFDRWTVGERVKKDDVTVAGLLDGFTLAQITEFITAAQEANATNVLALLLEYKNTRFADFDPMAEFTLEW